MWNSFEEWANTIENLDLEIFHNSKKNRKEIYDKTGIWSHAYARIYETPYEEVINPLLIPNNYFKIPLIGISYKQKPEYSFSSAHKFSQIGKEEEIDLFYTSKFKESIETKFGKLTTFVTFFSAGNFHSEIKGIPIMSSLVDFGKYLIQSRIKANLTAAGNRINFLL